MKSAVSFAIGIVIALMSSVVPAAAQGGPSGFGFLGWQRQSLGADQGGAWCGAYAECRAWGGGFELASAEGAAFVFESAVRHDRLIVSPGVAYQFAVNPRVVPFLTGGLALGVGIGDGGLGVGEVGATFGGGANVWLQRRVGVRVELRDYLPSVQIGGRSNVQEARIGIVIR